jgi:lipopolysaccharide export LptBFGC system permease protein LptF
MTRPGERLRRLSARVCSERTRTRLIDPAVADLQAEFAATRRNGSLWRRALVLGAGYLSIAKVLAIAAGGDLRRSATTWERDEARGARQGAWVALAIVTVTTVLLELPLLGSLSVGTGVGERFQLATYLAPSTLALTVPLGFAIATGWALHGAARTRKVAAVALVTAALMFPLMFANLAWLTPDANQAFRVAVITHEDPRLPAPLRGDGEMRFGDLRTRLRQARDVADSNTVRQLETLYYRKWSISAAPLAMVALAVALAFRRRWTRVGLTGVTCGVYAAQYALFMTAFPLAQRGVAQPIVLEWVGNALCVAAAVAITSSRRPA